MNLVSNDPEQVTFRHRQGSTQTIRLHFKEPDGSPEDITGRTYTFNIKKTSTSNVLLREFTSGNGAIVIIDGPNGILEIVLDDVSDPIPAGNWRYDLDQIEGAAVTPLLKHVFIVPGDV